MKKKGPNSVHSKPTFGPKEEGYNTYLLIEYAQNVPRRIHKKLVTVAAYEQGRGAAWEIEWQGHSSPLLCDLLYTEPQQ